jgi:hypothetical protein
MTLSQATKSEVSLPPRPFGGRRECSLGGCGHLTGRANPVRVKFRLRIRSADRIRRNPGDSVGKISSICHNEEGS